MLYVVPNNTINFRFYFFFFFTWTQSADLNSFSEHWILHFLWNGSFYLMDLADVISAPHNLALFLFECVVMVPGQLTASWTQPAEAFCINFPLKMPYQSRNSTSKGNLKGYCFLLSAKSLYPLADLGSGFIIPWRQLAHAAVLLSASNCPGAVPFRQKERCLEA